MKIEYFPALKGEAARVLIYGDEPNHVALLKERVTSLATGKANRFAVHELPNFEGVDACELYFSIGGSDGVVQKVGNPMVFDCTLPEVDWRRVQGLLEPFCTRLGLGHFQFLADCDASEIELIISTDRGW
jgi:hypothetical protein